MRKKLNIEEATSMNNGIIFYSKRHKGYVAMTTIDENGIITTEWTTEKESTKYKEKQEVIPEGEDVLTLLLFYFPFIILTYILLNINPIYALRVFLISYSLMLLSSFIVLTSRMRKKAKNLYKFHSAEHMVLNAYRKLGRVPSLEEIRQYSRFSNTCGTNSATKVVITLISFSACTFIPNLLWALLVLGFIQVIVFIFCKCGFLNFLQKFTTTPPTDVELSVAIAGMTVLIENDKKEEE